MNLAQWWVLWIGSQELIAGLLYLSVGQPWNGLAWRAYGVACVGLALAGR